MNPHDQYVADGGCPSVTPDKTWCNGFAGHPGKHWARRGPTPGYAVDVQNPAVVFWDWYRDDASQSG